MRISLQVKAIFKKFLVLFMFFLVFLLLFLNQLSAKNDNSDFLIISELSSVECLVGDRIHLSVVVEYPGSFKPHNIVPPDMGKDIKVFSSKISKPVSVEDGRKTISLNLQFAVFKTDEITLPPFYLNFKNKNGASIECVTAPLIIRIKSLVTEKDKDIKDIKGPIAIENGLPLWSLLVAAAVVITAAIIVFIILRKKKKSVSEETWLSLDPPHIEAYKSLDNLSRENLLAKAEYKKYYVILSDVIRKYIHRRFEIETMEQTTKEIIRQVEKLDVSREARNQLKEFMGQCDLVKFAKFVPTGSQARESLETAYYFVDVTKEETIIPSSSSPVEEKHPAPVFPAD